MIMEYYIRGYHNDVYEGYVTKLYLKLGYYQNKNIRIEVWEENEGPFAVLTKNLINISDFGNYAYIDTNNCPWAENFIKEFNLGTKTKQLRTSGYVEYPLYKLNMEEIKKNIL